MITQETTFVLGAGASAPYNFPSGHALFRQVVDTFSSSNNDKISHLQSLGYQKADIQTFARALQGSGKQSVDAFLEHRTDLLLIGKAAIAACLIPYEIEARFYQSQAHWYAWLFAALNSDPKNFAENKVRFVTFNYDRSLEHYLFTSLSNSYNLDETSAAKLVSSIPIAHVHGNLGNLPWQGDANNSRAYDGHLSPQTIRLARDSIRVIHEGRPDDPSLQTAQKYVQESKRLVFVGFGYHPGNLERLGLNPNLSFEYAGGSCWGMTELEQKRAERQLPKGFRWGYGTQDALEFLRNHYDPA